MPGAGLRDHFRGPTKVIMWEGGGMDRELCPALVSDDMETVTCSLPPGHDEDHGRGFLRWVDDTFWYSQRYRSDDGRWHALPYPDAANCIDPEI